MDLLAAIDLRGAGAVRLLKGDYAKETRYGDPCDLAQAFWKDGADWLHLVDLDGARGTESSNRAFIARIVADSPIPVECGGGIRTLADIDAMVEMGVQRVILGTAALVDPALLLDAARRHPGRVAVGLDYRRDAEGRSEVAVRGWEEGSGLTLLDAIERVLEAEVAALIVTAIDRDGTLEGPDIDELAVLLTKTSVPVVASGGVSSLDDLRALASLRGGSPERGLEGAVVGKALVEHRFSVHEAVAACR